MSGRGRASPRVNVFVWTVVPVAVGVVVWATPLGIEFLPRGPSSFWAMVLCALLVDVPLYGISGRDDTRIRTTMSPCFVITILVFWGAAPAIFVQAVAGAVSMVGQRSRAVAAVYTVSCLVLPLAVAELFIGAQRHTFTGQGTGLTGSEIIDGLALTGIWLTISYGLMVAARAIMISGGLRRAIGEIRDDLFRTTVTILLGTAVLTAITGWWPLLIGGLLLVWNTLLRGQVLAEKRLSREPVSGLLNRQGLLLGLRQVTAQGLDGWRGEQQCGVVLVSVASLLTISHTLGRDMAEKLVGLAARRLLDVYGANRVGQLSAENFVILMPELTADVAVEAAESAVGVLATPIRVDGIPVMLDPVGGVALCPDHGRDLATLLLKAELATAEARRQGRLATLYVRQAAEVTGRRITLLRALHTALSDTRRKREIGVLYQPQVELATGSLVGVEALLRWTHPEWGAIPTDELIEAVGPSMVMHLLTRHVLATVMAQAQRWNEQGRRLRLAVNVSVQDLHDPFLVPDLEKMLRQYGIAPTQLTIEITEQMLATDTPQVTHIASRLAELGVGLSLDDFGAGHASIKQLRQLPLTEVKVDRSYIARMVDDPVDREVVAGVHHVARALGVAIVAEGVEDERTARSLARLPGVIAQGWHFGYPMTAEELDEWSQSRHGAPSRR